MLTVGSLFAGIGGFDLGLERAGMRVKWQCEIDPYCRRVLAKHWPDVPKYGDIRTVDWSTVEPVDVLCGGFPCQPVSVAGRGLAQRDERWLWPEFARAIRDLRPRYVIVENVPGLLGRGFSDVLGDLAEFGMDAEWTSLPAAALGAPHLRWRLWVVAYSGNGGQRELFQPLGELGGDAATDFRGDGAVQSLADAYGVRELQGLEQDERGRPSNCGGWWAAEPNVGRVAHGVSKRVDRLRGLGNAVVPQIVEWIGRRILSGPVQTL